MTKRDLEIISQKELQQLIDKLVVQNLNNPFLIKTILGEELLTSEGISFFLKISRVTLWHLEKKGIVPFIRVGNQKRYQKSEVLQGLLKNNTPNKI